MVRAPVRAVWFAWAARVPCLRVACLTLHWGALLLQTKDSHVQYMQFDGFSTLLRFVLLTVEYTGLQRDTQEHGLCVRSCEE